MKAYKCPKCGYLDVPYNGATYTNCPECDTYMLDEKEVEIIDWEKELLHDKYNYVLGA